MSSRAVPAEPPTRTAVVTVDQWAAAAVVFVMAIRYRFSPDIPIGFLVSLAMLPVSLPYLLRHRGALSIALLAAVATIGGIALGEARPPSVEVDGSLMTVQSVRVLSIAVMLASLLWARSLLGLQPLVLLFGLGSFASLAVSGINMDNPWKFSLSVPTILVLLGLPWVWGHRRRQLVCVGALAVVSALADSRSLAAMLLIAVAIMLFQRRMIDVQSTRRKAWTAVMRLAIVAVAGYFAVQAAILEGMLGQAARERTEMQIDRSGSAIVGGRPEMGASFALIAENPVGYGAGALVTFDERMRGMDGMWSLGYDPNNGYVDKYMFGHGFEVHSVLGDLWLLYGLPGLALALVALIAVVFGVGSGLAASTVSAAGLFLGLRFLWDFGLSPFASAMNLLPLTLAVLLPLIGPRDSRLGSRTRVSVIARRW